MAHKVPQSTDSSSYNKIYNPTFVVEERRTDPDEKKKNQILTQLKVTSTTNGRKDSFQAFSRGSESFITLQNLATDDMTEAEDLNDRKRSFSAPPPILGILCEEPQKVEAPGSAYSSPRKHFTVTNTTVVDKSQASFFSGETEVEQKPKFTAKKEIHSSSWPPQVNSHVSREDCKTHVLQRKEQERRQTCLNQVEIMSSILTALYPARTQHADHVLTRVLIEKFILEAKSMNKKMLAAIDESIIRTNKDYFLLTQQIEKDFYHICNRIEDFYEEMEQLSNVLNKENKIVAGTTEIVEKKALCKAIESYLQEDRSNVQNIKNYKNAFFRITLTEQEDILNSLMKKHIACQFVLGKIYVGLIRNANVHLETHNGKMVWIEQSDTNGGKRKLATDLLLTIPLSLTEEKLLFHSLLAKCTQRVALREIIPNVAEDSGIKMINEWLTLINKGAGKLDESKSEKE